MSEGDLLNLVKEVSATLQGIAGDPTRLAKNDPEASPEASPSAPPGAPSGAPAGEPSAPPMDPSAPPGPPPSEPGAPGAEGAPAAGPSFEELVTLYSQLPPEDFEAHAAAIQAAAQARSGAGGAGTPPGAAPSAAPSAPPGAPPSAPPGGQPAFKSEDSKALATALKTIETLTKSQAEQKQAIEALGKVVTMPQRRAVTGITFIPMQKTEEAAAAEKSFESMTKSELHDRLVKMTASDGLKKSERDLITDFYLGKVPRKDLAPIFKR